MRLSGWQKIGALVSILWMIGLPICVMIDSNRRASEFYNVCRKVESNLGSDLGTEQQHEACWRSADQARRRVGKPRFHLAARPFLPQRDRTALILANDVKRVLADIDPDHGNRAVEFCGMACSLSLAPPASFSSSGAGAGPDHPLPGMGADVSPQSSWWLSPIYSLR